MAIHMPRIINAKKMNEKSSDVPKGYIAVYVGADKKRFIISISCLHKPSFQALLRQAEEDFGFDHPTGGLMLPFSEDVFIDITSQLNTS